MKKRVSLLSKVTVVPVAAAMFAQFAARADGGWYHPVPWGDHRPGFGGSFDLGWMSNPDGFVDAQIGDFCNQIVPMTNPNPVPTVVVPGGGPAPRPAPAPAPAPRPGNGPHPAPAPAPAPAPTIVVPGGGPAAPAWDRQAALRDCEMGRHEAIEQGRRATYWIGLNQGWLAAFEDGRRDGAAMADPSAFASGLQMYSGSTSQQGYNAGAQLGGGQGASRGQSEVIQAFENSVSATGGVVPANAPQSNLNISFNGLTTGWYDTGRSDPDYSIYARQWLNQNLNIVRFPPRITEDDYFRYGMPQLADANGLLTYAGDRNTWANGYAYRVDRIDWDDDNDGWGHFNHGTGGDFFQKGYRAHYRNAAGFWYQIAFYQGANFGDPHLYGQLMGKYVQEQFNEQLGEKQGFTEMYRRDSARGYADSYTQGYRQAYASTYADYANNAKLSFQLVSVQGPMGDYIAGEDVRAVLHVRNYGGQPASLLATTNLTAAASTGKNSQQFGINRLQEADFTTDLIGMIPKGLIEHGNANVQVNLAQLVSGGSVNLGTQGESLYIDSRAEIAGLRWVAPYEDFVNGKAHIEVTVRNPLPIQTNGNVTVVINDASASLGVIPAGGQAKTTLTISVDPMAVISSDLHVNTEIQVGGSTDVEVTARYPIGVAFVQDPTMERFHQFQGRNYWAAMYFNKLANQGASTDAVSKLIVSIAQNEVATANDVDKNLWGDGDTNQGTILVQLANSFANQGNKPQAVLDAYTALGQKLYPVSNSIDPHGLFGRWDNRDGFRNAVKSFAPAAVPNDD